MKLNKIIDIVNEEFDVDITSNKRNLQNMYALKTYVHLARENTYYVFEEIGKRVNRSYSNIMHHLNGKGNIIELIKINKDLAEKFNNCESKVKDMNVKKMKVKIKKMHPDAVIPAYAKDGDAGMDLTAISKEQIDNEHIKYGFGIAMEIPKGYVGLIFPRSSCYKRKQLLSNAVGVIDSGYRGEISAVMIGTTDESYNVGDRIAQIIILPYPQIEFKEVEELSESERGTGGYGSTGK